MLYLWLKALHVIAVISWMAGILYFWRLLVNHAMETEAVVIERFKGMERRLRRAIMTPAMIATVLFGGAMIAVAPGLLKQPWMHVKLTLVVLLLINHWQAVRAEKRFGENPRAFTDKRMRVMNEVPTLLMIGIVLLVILKPVFG
jgi:putative membrane protein